MSDSFITIMIILIAAVLMFMVPVMTVSKRRDVAATQSVQAAVTEFVDKTRTTGMIKQEDYDSLLEKLEATGNKYDVSINIQYIDENPSKKTSSNVLDSIKIGENLYYIEYTAQVEEEFKKKNDGIIKLEAGDYIKIDVENKNQTLYQNFKKTLYNLSGGNVGTIEGIHIGLVIETTDGQQVGIEKKEEMQEQYKILYDANGGIQSTCPYETEGYMQTKSKGELLTLSYIKPIHSNSNLKFVGWSEEPNASEPSYVSGGIFEKDKNTTLYAIWKEERYNVVYWSNLTQVIDGLPTEDTGLKKGEVYTIWNKRDQPSTEGKKFVNWNTKADGSGEVYNSGDTIVIEESKILYAIWESEDFIIKYNKNAGEDNVEDMPLGGESYFYNKEFTLPTDIPKRENYKFLGWATRQDGIAEYQPGEKCVLQSGENTLYAIWELNAYEITFDTNQGNIQGTSSKTVVYNKPYGTLPNCTRTGYTFEGWYTKLDGGTQIKESTIVATNSNQTLYAHWTPNKYTIYFAKNGGNMPSPDSITATYDSIYGTLATCSRTDYTFDGWYTEPSGGTKVESSTIVKITFDQTLYAHWIPNKVYLTDLSSSTAYFKEGEYKTNIKNILFVDYVDTTGAVKTYDLSENKDNNITGWIIKNSDNTYNLYIGSDYDIYSRTLSHAFDGMTGVENIVFNNLNTSETTTMEYMFSNCKNLVSLDVTSFDTSNVNNMKHMFENLYQITNLDVSRFNTINVSDMASMFHGLSSLKNLDLSNFKTSNVTRMSEMFRDCKNLNELDLLNFNTAKVKKMETMFYGCSSLKNLYINNFDTSNVIEMQYMFFGCSSLEDLDVTNFNTANVENMFDMFYNCSSLTRLDISNFNTSKTKNMGGMFYNCKNLTSLDVSKFITSEVVNMSYMFGEVSKITDLNVSNFNTSKVTRMEYMFYNCKNLESLDVSNFDTSNVINMKHMFQGLEKITMLDLKKFNTSKVEEIHEMFHGMTLLKELDLSNFDTSSVKNSMWAMFEGCSSLETLNISNFNTTQITHMHYMFKGCSKLKIIDFREASFDSVTEWSNMFNDIPDEIKIIVKDTEAKKWVQERIGADKGTVVTVSEL